MVCIIELIKKIYNIQNAKRDKARSKLCIIYLLNYYSNRTIFSQRNVLDKIATSFSIMDLLFITSHN